MLTPESALVILVPAAEPLVSPFRDLYDPSAVIGLPAHVTILYPFKPPNAIDEVVRDDLRRCFSGFGAFNFELTAIRRFGDEVLYLGLEPAEPFRELTRAAHEYSPETPPYSGRFVDSVPHLTVAQRHAGTLLDEIALKLQSAAAGKLPIRTRANEVVLMDTCMGGWEISERLPLAP